MLRPWETPEGAKLFGRGSRGRGLVGGLCPAWETGFLLACAGWGWVSNIATSRAVVDKFTSQGVVAGSAVEASTRFVDLHSLSWSVGCAGGQGFGYWGGMEEGALSCSVVRAITKLTGPPSGAWRHYCGGQEGRGQLIPWVCTACCLKSLSHRC